MVLGKQTTSTYRSLLLPLRRGGGLADDDGQRLISPEGAFALVTFIVEAYGGSLNERTISRGANPARYAALLDPVRDALLRDFFVDEDDGIAEDS